MNMKWITHSFHGHQCSFICFLNQICCSLKCLSCFLACHWKGMFAYLYWTSLFSWSRSPLRICLNRLFHFPPFPLPVEHSLPMLCFNSLSSTFFLFYLITAFFPLPCMLLMWPFLVVVNIAAVATVLSFPQAFVWLLYCPSNEEQGQVQLVELQVGTVKWCCFTKFRFSIGIFSANKYDHANYWSKHSHPFGS